MQRTLVAVFDQPAAAQHAIEALTIDGFDRQHLSVTRLPTPVDDPGQQAPAATDVADSDGVFAHVRSFFAEIFGPHHALQPHHLERYSDTMRRGGAIVRVRVEDDAGIALARRTLEAAGAVDIEEHVAAAG